MEHLSPEERACLTYLEETIEALEVQEDSGLSNDEPDPGSQAEIKRINDISAGKSGMLSHAAAEPASTALTTETEQHALSQTSEPQSNPAAAASTKDGEAAEAGAQHNPASAAGCKIHSSATPTELQGLSSEIDVALIPPPSDFMDEPDISSQPEKIKELPPMSRSKPGATIDLEQLRQRASAKKTSVSSSVTEEPPSRPAPDVPPLSPPAVTSGALATSPSEAAAEPRSPPAVAPKPKKLPPNIIPKTHKATSGPDGHAGHSVPSSSDRVILDPQRVRIEALRKLGLLKSSETNSGPAVTPKLSPKTRKSWAAPSPPISPATLHAPPSTPSESQPSSPPPDFIPPLPVSPTAVGTPAPDILPAPAAFSDPIRSPPSKNDPTTANTPPQTPPTLVKQLTPPKSATLERSGLGLSSYMARQNSSEAAPGAGGVPSPSQLRNSRPRPASLGSGKEFSGHAATKEPDTMRPLHGQTAFQHSRDSQKLPRSQGISVLICPRAENGGDRREALKKLGLLRD
ncbi:specifically androgen-regulated gene protein isoform X2 [Parambassis ranga]|nr:specifically androgen-regulated gene protein-like isoform X2 [Parambassis ranga]